MHPMRSLPRFRPISGLIALGLMVLVAAPAVADPFGDYWYQGQAEITTYTLEQARYGEVHPGHAVLIFVTEDFSRSKHVKLDNPSAAGDDRVPVLKLNATKSFYTGVYPYSLMTSVFSPLDTAREPNPLKITTTTQEWCGHTFSQIDRTATGFDVRHHSYFESEGDFDAGIVVHHTEDGLWNLIRLDPEALPRGELELLIGTQFQRLSHQTWTPRIAQATLEVDPENSGLRIYTLSYPSLGRTLAIRFRAEFPHTIEGWEEVYRSGWGSGAQVLTTRATKKERRMLDYWSRHDLADAPLRRELGLED